MSYKILRTATADEQLAKWKVLGHSVIREDAYKKATARDEFCDDVQLDGMLYGVHLHSPYAHAKITKLDTSKAEQLPGVVGIVTYKDVVDWGMISQQVIEHKPGEPSVPGAPAHSMYNKVFYVGDHVAAIAAVDFGVAEQARDLIEVEYEELPFYLTPEDAMAQGATVIHPEWRTSNIQSVQALQPAIFGNEAAIEAGLAQADEIIETEYREPAIKHMFLEHQTSIARWRGDELDLWVSAQGTRQIWMGLAQRLGLPQTKVHVYTHHPGGGFGGKVSFHRTFLINALLAKKVAPRPVKMRTNAREQFVVGNKLEFGPSSWKFKIGVKQDGTITAIKASVLKGQGALSVFQIRHGLSNFAFNYRCPAKEYVETGVFTNALDAGALRAYGSQCACFALDGAMNEVSEKIGMDHADFIIKNGGRAGDNVSDTGHICAGGSFPVAMQKLISEFNWKSRWKGWGVATSVNGAKRRGLGVGIANHCTGEFSAARDGALVLLNNDLSAEVVHNISDVGNGGDTAGCMIVAEVLGIPYEKVGKSPRISTSSSVSGICYCASRGLPTINTAVWNAAQDVKRQLLQNGAYIMGITATPDQLDIQDQKVYLKSDPTKSVAYSAIIGTLGPIHGIGYGLVTDGAYAVKDPVTGRDMLERGIFCCAVEVEVDTETGEVKVVDYLVVPQGGNVVNPELLRGQIIGGVVHGISQMLGEGYIYDDPSGTPLNTAVYNYQTMSSMDVDKATLHIAIDSDPADAPLVPFHAKGLAEGIYCAAWPAITMAIYNATKEVGGSRLREFPFQPERVLSSLGKATFPKTKSVA